ncbi:MAG: DGQHR domain-containing protein [Oscillospiraceae bacterium]|nr:DGQHR domain-containing protein [Oscillospiraceae bacterium]
MKYIDEPYLAMSFGTVSTHVFKAKVRDILQIYYIAVRGRDDIEGAVQRLLNPRRINDIKNFILRGNVFLTPFIMNWTENKHKPKCTDGVIRIPITPSAAQVIDGQHRLFGLSRAIEEKPSIGEMEVLIILTQYINTKEAAQIFLNINAEQKPVPKSLVYDLFGEVRDKDFHIVRATELADKLHVEEDSAFYQLIKKPGAPIGSGKVDLSAVVGAIKDYLEDDGIFQQYKLSEMETQYRVINNYFTALKNAYESNGGWLSIKNPFLTNSGFYASIKFLCEDLIPKCSSGKSFTIESISHLMQIDSDKLIYREDIKNLSGKEQRSVIYNYLKRLLLREVPDEDEYEF